MLQVGLTGGIGSGKSTVALRLVERGAVLVDADALAREVVAPGTAGLAEIVDAFGAGVLAPDGALDRPALAAVVFADDAARARLNAITHPRVRERSAQVVDAAAPDAVVVQDVPLLVEGGMAARFALVLVVGADEEVRVRRLVDRRGMAEPDARARIAAQADDAARRAVADVWIDNGGSQEATVAVVDRLWADRIVPFEANVRARQRAERPEPRLVDSDPEWPAAAARLGARIEAAAGELGRGVAHIGSTAVAGLAAKDVIDLQLGVASIEDADRLRDRLADAGFPAVPRIDHDNPKPPGSPVWPKRYHASADPGRPVNLHVRVVDGPGWRYALLFRDWLRATPEAVADYLAVKRRAEAGGDGGIGAYVATKEPWFDAAADSAQRWAASCGWSPSLH